MAISADMVKKLREQTGAGMMDCKKALTETDGDYEKAIAILREKGIAVAAKREARSASEGIIAVYSSDDAQIGVMVELNCETTFVAKTDEFIALANNIAAHIGNTSPELSDLENMESVLTQKYYADQQHTIQDLINNNIAKLGEKTTLGRFVRVDVGGENHERNGAIGTYIHMGNQIGVMVELNCETEATAVSEGMQQLAKDLAMHISWSVPEYIETSEIPVEVIEAEKEINRQRAIQEGKPENIVEKIVEGRIKKEFYAKICLMDQPFVKDESQCIDDLVKTAMRDTGEVITVARFVRFRVGEKSGE